VFSNYCELLPNDSLFDRLLQHPGIATAAVVLGTQRVLLETYHRMHACLALVNGECHVWSAVDLVGGACHPAGWLMKVRA
jgi:hypothetical protein